MPALALAEAPSWDDLEASLAALERHGELEAYLASRDPATRILLEKLQAERGIGWRAHPAAMAAHFVADFQQWAYVRLLSHKFTEAADGTNRWQIWNVPARYGKSTVASRWGPVWLLARNPRANIILTSYADTLAMENAHAVRDALAEHRAELGVELRPDRRRIDRFVTKEGGGILARGIDSGISGFGAGRGGGIIIDDPFKNWEEASSPTTRQAVWRAWQGVLRLRLDDDSAFVIVCHTRWHEDDLTGRLMLEHAHEDGSTWDVTRLAAIAEAHDPDSLNLARRLPDPLGRAPGEPLERERFSLLEVRSRAQDLGTYLASALEAQAPTPEEGGDLKRGWWKWHDEAPAGFETGCTSWDFKMKEADAGDYVAGQAWGRTGPDYWLLGAMRGRWDQPTVRAAIALLSVRHPWIGRHYLENTGNGPEVLRELRKSSPGYVLSDDIAGALGITPAERPKVQALLRRGLTGLLAVNPKGSKTARVRAISGRVEAGNVHLTVGMVGAAVLVNEAAAFPNGDHDDTVDAMTQALVKLGSVHVGGAASTTRRVLNRSPMPTGGPPTKLTPVRRRRRVR